MEPRTHLDDVNVAIAAAELDADGVDAPLVGLLRSLAVKMDRAGDDGPSDRLLAAYLSATKDLSRSLARRTSPVAKPDPPVADAPSLHAVEESPLAQYRRKHPRAS